MKHTPKDRTYYLVAVVRRYHGNTTKEPYNHFYIISHETGRSVLRADLWNNKTALEWDARMRNLTNAYMTTMSDVELEFATTHATYGNPKGSL